jgi:hypothetical protein
MLAVLLLGEPLAESDVLFGRDREPLSFSHLVMWRLSRFHTVTRGTTISRRKAAKLLQRGRTGRLNPITPISSLLF